MSACNILPFSRLEAQASSQLTPHTRNATGAPVPSFCQSQGQLRACRRERQYVVDSTTNQHPHPPSPPIPFSYSPTLHESSGFSFLTPRSHSEGSVSAVGQGAARGAGLPNGDHSFGASAHPAWPGESAAQGSQRRHAVMSVDYISTLPNSQPVPDTSTNRRQLDDHLLGFGSQFDGCLPRRSA